MSQQITPISEETEKYLIENFSSEDNFLQQILLESAAAGMPQISIGGIQGAFLQFLLKAIDAQHVLEIGSLAGYSAITMARALPPHGKVVCMEYNPDFAHFIAKKADEAGISSKIEVYAGDAKHILADYKPEFSFDFVFIDADKQGYEQYLQLVYPMVRKGGIIAGDNALAWGQIGEENPKVEANNVRALQAFNHALRTHPGLSSCLVPIGDGMAMGVKL